MTDAIRPFYRRSSAAMSDGDIWSLRLMRLHFLLAGLALFLSALGIVGTLYQEFDNIDLGWDLRVARAGKIYETSSQIKLMAALALAGASLLQFQAVKQVGRHSGLWWARLAALMLLAGFPASWAIWNLEVDIPGLPVSYMQRVLQIASVLLAVQALLAVWYLVRLFSRGMRNALQYDSARSPLRTVQRVVIGLWLLVIVGVGIVLGVMTGWIYEFPVPDPEPGELLYATSFDAETDLKEWDIYSGRDSALVVQASELSLDGSALAGNVMVITYGSPYQNQVVFSSPDRKFSDMDFHVTARPVSGPLDNQYGVFFRYRDRDNYYGFFISSDGYYSLVKRQDGMFSEISAWGESNVIQQGEAPNVIRIVAQGDEFRFFVNDEPMPLCLRGDNLTSMWAGAECVTDDVTYVYRDGDFKQGRIALAAGSSVDLNSEIVVAFDDVVIVGPEE